MDNIWTKKWKSALIWMSAYMNFVAFALVGGYFIIKSNDDDLKKTTKKAFIVTVVMGAIGALLSLFNHIASFSDSYYLSDAYEFYVTCSSLLNIARIVVYAVFIILALVKNDEPVKEEISNSDTSESNE